MARILDTLYQRFLQLPRNQRGALWMLASALCFTLMTSLVKYLGRDFPAVLQTFYRQAVSFVVLIPLILRAPRRAFATTRPGLMVFRATMGFLGMSLSFYSYQHLPLADANALSFTRTLWIVLLAAVLLREPLGVQRIGATLCGFLGVLLIVHPSGDGNLGWPAAAALISALMLAMTITGMKAMSRDHSTLTLMTWSALLGLLLSAIPSLYVWRWPGAVDLLLLTLMGVLGTLTQTCYIKGMTAGDATVMAPMDYARLLFAVLAGWLLFHTLPTLLTAAGSLIIIVSTLYITLVESRRNPTEEEI